MNLRAVLNTKRTVGSVMMVEYAADGSFLKFEVYPGIHQYGQPGRGRGQKPPCSEGPVIIRIILLVFQIKVQH